MLVREALLQATEELKIAGVESPRLDAEVLLAFALRVAREELPLKINEVSKTSLKDFNALIERRKKREPVARITGVQEFWSLPFQINQDTLIPRPDSETLVEAALQKIAKDKPMTILDLGTGSGCLLLAILSERPLATGVGVDASEKALECARKNAKHLGLDRQASFKVFDWMNDDQPPGQFDIVLSNPPYIPGSEIQNLQPEVAHYEPNLALNGGPDGLTPYRVLVPFSRAMLSGKGWVLFEIGEAQEEEVRKILWETNFETLETFKDLAGNPRVVAGFCPFG